MTQCQFNRLEAIVAEIVPNLLEAPTDEPIGLMSGRAGHALAVWYARHFNSDLVDENQFSEMLSELQGAVPYVSKDHRFSRGLPGVAWLFELLLWEQDDPYLAEFNQNVDRILLNLLQVESWQGEIELMEGLSGLAPYAARRLKQANQTAVYKEIIRHFSDLAVWIFPDQCTWPNPPNSPYNMKSQPEEPEHNLGLAHGVPAVLAALIAPTQHKDLSSVAKPLLQGGANWLAAQRQDSDELECHYGYLAGEPSHSRLGWCYGDASNALILARAGAVLNDKALIQAARTVALHAASRSPEAGLVRDGGLCHGSAGLSLIFSLLHTLLGDPELQNAAEFWLEDTIKRYENHGLNGFDAYRYEPENGKPYFVADTGFLAGYAGVALALMAATEQSPDWGDCLLLL
ncbi:lanthionine synthetase C family protein [Natronospira proteinivora]|nr:lanthionine synthetase C family protein [Natronospira proteinivora]